jgi:hypothetical protein
MSYEILMTAESLRILHITEAYLNSFKGWRIQFDDGKEAMVYYGSDEWMQYKEDWLDKHTLMAIGNCIDSRTMEKTSGTPDSFFYNMLIINTYE